MPEPIQIDIKSSTLEVLLKYVRDGIEATAGTWMLPWQAHQKAEALRRLSDGQGDAMNILTTRNLNLNLDVQLDGEIGGQVITAHGKKRIDNLQNIAIGAAQELENQDVEYHEPDPDFTARFFGDAQDVSDKQLQSLWSKLLAGEVQHPGQTSHRTLSVLRDMSRREASIFQECSQYVVNNEFIFMRDRPQARHGMPGTTLYAETISLMQAAGLIAGTFEGQVNYDTTINPFIFFIHSTHFYAERGDGAGKNLRIPILLLTPAGQELCRVTRHYEPPEPYLKELARFLHRNNYRLYLLDKLQEMPDGKTSYSKKSLIQPA
jgi:hypothetical protein